jgi:hypothetical protein
MTELQKAIDVLQKALKEDEGYRYSWQANIAMAFKDEHSRQKGRTSRAKVHVIANNAADYFLKLLCDEFKYPEGR